MEKNGTPNNPAGLIAREDGLHDYFEIIDGTAFIVQAEREAIIMLDGNETNAFIEVLKKHK